MGTVRRFTSRSRLRFAAQHGAIDGDVKRHAEPRQAELRDEAGRAKGCREVEDVAQE
jgi:hypothetical protein